MNSLSDSHIPLERQEHPFFNRDTVCLLILFASVCLMMYVSLFGSPAWAGNTHLPGEDASGKLEAAGTLLRILDTGLFKWGARIFAGICIMSSAWALKEQRFAIAIISVVGAIVFGTAPKWVKNIFEISDEQSLFTLSEPYNYPTPYLPKFTRLHSV